MKQSSRPNSPCIVSLALALCLSSCAETTTLSTIRVAGREVPAAGHVQVERNKKKLPALTEMTLQPGDTISTATDTTLVIRIGDTRAVLMPSTKVSLGSIFTWFGRVFISGWLQGKTKLVTGAVKGTQYVVEVDEKSGLTTISVLEGTVHVSSVKQLFPEIVLTAAQRVRVPEQLRQPPTAEPIERGEYNTLIDAANRARDEALDKLLLPDLTGVRPEEAEAELRQGGFEVSRRDVIAPSPDAVGLVANQVPRAGTAARRVELQVGRPFKKGTDKAQIMAPSQIAAGAQLPLTWTGPNLESDRIALVQVGTPDREYLEGLVLPARGGHGELRAPAETGTYELRFLTEERSDSVLARVPLRVMPVSATLQVPKQAVAGSTIQIAWKGPNRKDDQIRLLPVGAPDNLFIEANTLSAALGQGSLRAPASHGEYEIRYGLAGALFKAPVILARARLTVTPAQAQVTAVGSCEAGASFAVQWQGPSGQYDAIHLVPVGEPDSRHYPGLTLAAATGRGMLRAPAEPGEYELRYALSGSALSGATMQPGTQFATATIIARTKITVTPAQAAFGAVASATAGSMLKVSWTGPNRDDDRILLVPANWSDMGFWEHLTLRAHNGSGQLRLPASAGDYELRYRLGGATVHGSAIIARTQFTVSPATATISSPAAARVDTELKLTWSGPNFPEDRVLLVPVKMRDELGVPGFSISAASGHGNLRTPHEAGDYELRYMLGVPALEGNLTRIIGRTKLRIVP